MSGFVETMRLKERAEEDIYFARRDRELIEALHRKRAQSGRPTDDDAVDREKRLAAPQGS